MKIKNIVFLILFIITNWVFVQAQTIKGVADKKSYNIGDRIEFSFKVPFNSTPQTIIVSKNNSDSLELQNTIIDTMILTLKEI